jgi:hypothetical protein
MERGAQWALECGVAHGALAMRRTMSTSIVLASASLSVGRQAASTPDKASVPNASRLRYAIRSLWFLSCFSRLIGSPSKKM